MSQDHKLTVLNGQVKLRHPDGCDVTLCEVGMGVEISKSVSLFSNGLYRVELSDLGSVHLYDLYPQKVS